MRKKSVNRQTQNIVWIYDNKHRMRKKLLTIFQGLSQTGKIEKVIHMSPAMFGYLFFNDESEGGCLQYNQGSIDTD